MEDAVKDKKYVFDLNRPFNIKELKYDDHRIPKYLQRRYFYLETFFFFKSNNFISFLQIIIPT